MTVSDTKYKNGFRMSKMYKFDSYLVLYTPSVVQVHKSKCTFICMYALVIIDSLSYFSFIPSCQQFLFRTHLFVLCHSHSHRLSHSVPLSLIHSFIFTFSLTNSHSLISTKSVSFSHLLIHIFNLTDLFTYSHLLTDSHQISLSFSLTQSLFVTHCTPFILAPQQRFRISLYLSITILSHFRCLSLSLSSSFPLSLPLSLSVTLTFHFFFPLILTSSVSLFVIQTVSLSISHSVINSFILTYMLTHSHSHKVSESFSLSRPLPVTHCKSSILFS